MKPFIASLINALFLIGLGMWGYLGSETPSVTALIPVFAGILLLLLNRGLKNENKTVAHGVVLLTLLVLIGLIKPLTGSIHRNDTVALIRVLVMMIFSIVAIVTFIKSFIDARKAR